MGAGRGERMTEGEKLYRLADWFPTPILKQAGKRWQMKYLRAVHTGERRAPRKGEWFLYGGDEAWLAPNDIDQPFSIVRIVRIEHVTTERIVEQL